MISIVFTFKFSASLLLLLLLILLSVNESNQRLHIPRPLSTITSLIPLSKIIYLNQKDFDGNKVLENPTSFVSYAANMFETFRRMLLSIKDENDRETLSGIIAHGQKIFEQFTHSLQKTNASDEQLLFFTLLNDVIGTKGCHRVQRLYDKAILDAKTTTITKIIPITECK